MKPSNKRKGRPARGRETKTSEERLEEAMQRQAHRRDMKRFGSTIRAYRLRSGLTLEALAHIAGLTENYIGTIENGKRDPSLTTMRALADGLDVPLGELLGGSTKLKKAGREAARMFDQVDPTLREPISQLLKIAVSEAKAKPLQG